MRGLASLPKNLNNFESLSEASPKLPHSSLKQKVYNNNTSNDLRQISSSSKVNSQRYTSQDASHKRENHLFNSDSWIKHELLEKPIPPSLKTIPSKKQLIQKRPTLIFTRNNSHAPKVSSSSSSQQKDSNDLSPQSPLFHIR